MKNKIVIKGQTRQSFQKTHLESQTDFYTSPYTIWSHYTSISPELCSAYMYGIVALPITPHSGLRESVPVYIGDIREELWLASQNIQLGPISNLELTRMCRNIQCSNYHDFWRIRLGHFFYKVWFEITNNQMNIAQNIAIYHSTECILMAYHEKVLGNLKALCWWNHNVN